MERGFTGNQDVEREILMNLDDKSLLEACITNNYMKTKVCNDPFLIRRMKKTYPGALDYKPSDKTWRQYFLETIYFTDKMRTEFNYNYSFGDAQKQYNIFSIFKGDPIKYDVIVTASITEKQNALAIHYLKNIILTENIAAHLMAFGDLEILKYAFENLPDFKTNYGELGMSNVLRSSNREKFDYLISIGIVPPPGIFPKLNLSDENFIKHLIDTGLFKNDYQEAVNNLTRYKISNPLYIKVLHYLLKHGAVFPKDVSKKIVDNYNKMVVYLNLDK